MAIINDKALVKDGKPLDRVYSNGQLVYGRNLLKGSIKYTKDSPKTLTSNKTDGWTDLYNDVYVNKLKAGVYTLNAKTDGVWVNHLSTTDPEKHGVGLWLMSTTGSKINISLGSTVPKAITVPIDDDYCIRINTYSNGTTYVTQKFWDFKLEKGSTATPLTPAPEYYI